ncbi:MAG: 50S ribosomal protein L28, partial [Mycobacterium sp.]
RVTLRVSTKGIKIIDRDGIESVVARLRRDGQKI